MNNETLIAGLIGILIGIVLTWLLAPVWVGMMGYSPMMGTRNNNDWGMMDGSIDAHFIEQMIPHHEDAITMANVALEKASHQEIKQLAQDITRTQSEEITTMRQWYKDWYGKNVPNVFSGMGPGMMRMGMMGNETDMEKLETAADFDEAFIEEMIPHHQMAVMMAQMLSRTTNRAEMKQLAKDIIEAQTREINLMRDWYGQWYGQAN